MSLFVRVERLGREPTVISVRDLSATFGEDSDGLFTVKQVHTPWFHLFSVETDYFLQPLRDNAPLKLISSGMNLNFQDHTFTFVTTPAEAAVLAANVDGQEVTATNTLTPLATISVAVAHTSKTFPLFEGAQFSIGSCDNDIINLPYDGIRPAHLNIHQERDQTKLWSEEGSFAINGESFSSTPTSLKEGEIVLTPSKITLLLRASP